MGKSLRRSLVLLVLVPGLLSAATKTSVASGNWSASATWSPAGAPGNNDAVVIGAGTTVTLDVNSNMITTVTINAGGVLQGDGTGNVLSMGKAGGEDFTNNGTLDGSGAHAMTVRLNKSAQWGGTGTYNVNGISLNGKTLSFTAGTAVVVNMDGAGDPFGTGGTVTPGATSTFNYTGTSAQVISSTAGISFNSIAVSNGAGVTLAKNLGGANFTGDLTINSGGVLNTSDGSTNFTLTGTAGRTFTIAANGTLVLGSTGTAAAAFPTGFTTNALAEGSTVQYSNGSTASQTVSLTPAYGNLLLTGSGAKSAGNGTLTVKGDWTNNSAGAVTFGASNTVVMGSSSASSHQIGGSTSTTFQNLTINNANGVSLGGNEAVAGTLTFTSGIVTTGGSTLALNAGGTVSRTSGHVNGNFQKNVPAGAASLTYEVGDAGAYSPVSVAFGNVTVAGNLTAKAVAGDHPNVLTSPVNDAKSVNRYWSLVNSGVSFNNYNATFTFVPGDVDGGANTANFIAGKYNAPNWSMPSVGTKTSTSTQITGETSFSDFALGEIRSFGVTASSGANGSVTPAGTTNVNYGGSQSYTITPNAAYHVADVTVDGVSVGAVTSYNFTNVTAAHSIAAAFANNTFTITASAGANGSIAPSGAVVVNETATQGFTITPSTGYHVADVLVDGGSVGAVTTYDFTNVAAAHTIAASFAIDTFTVTAASGANGSVSPSGAVHLTYGSSRTFTFTPSTGYHVADVLVDGVSVGAPASYDVTNIAANHTVDVSFAINVYTITASAGANGSISPSGAVGVNHGAGQSFTITPNASYHVADVLVDGLSVGAVTTYDFTNVTGNHTIAASFAINTFTVDASAGANGAISPSGSVVVNEGSGQSFTVTPSAGYHVADVLVDGGSVGAVASYDFTNVVANHTIAASFAIDTFTVTASAGANGTIAPAGATEVLYGGSQSYTVTPATGYHVAALTVDGSPVAPATTYNFTSVAANHTIDAAFAIDTMAVTASAGANGTISPSGAVAVLHGGSQSFTVSPATGYHVADVLVDGGSVGAVTTYDFTNVTANHTIAASFAIDTLTVTASAGANGSISPSGAVAVLYGGSRSFTVTPAAGYHVADVLVDGASVGAVTTYDFTNVAANHTIVASFTINGYTITATAGANGSISPSGAVGVNHGASQAFTITPNAGYHVAGVLVDGVPAGAVTTYDFTNVTANHTIDATFALDTLTITASAGPNGTIAPSGAVHAPYGSDQAFTITPDVGYFISDVHVDSVSVGAVAGYTFTAVAANHTIHAVFAPREFTLHASAAAHGTISPSGAVPASFGGSQAFTITPDTGYFVSDVHVDSASVGGVTHYTFSNITADHTIEAFFAVASDTITASAGAHGTITPSGRVAVLHGGSQSFAVAADSGYHVADVLVDGVSAGAVASYNFTNVTSNHTIAASFAVNPTHDIVASAGAHGTITPSGTVVVNDGADQSFTIAPDTGYFVADVHVDSVSVGAVTHYAFTNVTANHTISATFALRQFVIHAAADSNGVISPSGSVAAGYGGSQAFTITPDTGYFISDVHVDSVSVGAVANYTFTNIRANHTIQASFAIRTFTVTALADSHGTVTPSGAVVVNYNGSRTFRIRADSGYVVTNVVVDTVALGAVDSVEFRHVTANHTLHASFAPANHPPTAPALAQPLNNDSLEAGSTPTHFAWHPSSDPDAGDTLEYSMHLWGTNVDTTLAHLSDTSRVVDLTGKAQEGAVYRWTVYVTDGHVTVASADTFAFTSIIRTSVADAKSRIPKVYALYQNYPNPFNPVTRLQYDIPKASTVTLIVYNILGAEVARLVDHELKEPGVWYANLDGSNLASGIYIYRIAAEGAKGQKFESVKKMMLLK